MTSPAGSSTIHDIGYRHYDGPRQGRTAIRRALYVQSLRGSFGLGRATKSKVLPALLFGVMVLVAGIMAAVTIAAKLKDLPLDYTRFAIVMQAVIGLFLAAQAPQAVSHDLRFKTMPLYFSRPLETADYVRAKFAATATALFILTGTPLLVMYIGALLAKFDIAEQTKGFAQGLVSVALLSLLFAGIGLVVSAVTPRRGFGVAAVIAVFTISYGAVSTLQGIAYTQSSGSAVSWLGLFSPITLIDGVQSAFLGASPAWPGAEDPSVAQGLVFLLLVLGLVAGCYSLLLRRYRKAVL
ncbi:ABC transporter permease [Streptomyces sp. SPB074]|uniref:ABC transporter permease n=1 Tax=Streptomyces sp. (strain SPB074) TaxID=465543 RepID=UPI00017F1B5F|nr:ABC transporter permease [Streptomyces sp. SPB074]EDY45205.1 integral membrane protein [Streptomyces sp. SPB074]